MPVDWYSGDTITYKDGLIDEIPSMLFLSGGVLLLPTLLIV